MGCMLSSINLFASACRKQSELQFYDYLKKVAVVYEEPVLMRSTRSTISFWHVNSANPAHFLAVPVLCSKTGFFILEEPKLKNKG